MTQREAVAKNPRAVPRPDPACPKCLGAGEYHDPPLAVQEREARSGERRWSCKTPCDCYRDDE